MKIAPPNYTQTPNIFFDEIMKTLKKEEINPEDAVESEEEMEIFKKFIPVTGGSPTKEPICHI